MLYLDPDIVINRSLEEFYNLDLKGNILAGATHLFGRLGKINLLRLGIHKHTDIYINAGVLLIDLKKWRETVTLGQILTYISKKHRTLFLADQDVVNALFADHTPPSTSGSITSTKRPSAYSPNPRRVTSG